jgi:hypothetical protein
LEAISLDDHLGTLKSYDSNGVGVVKLHCVECNKDIGGSSGDHTKITVYNLFVNFRKSHVLSNGHVRNWCRRKGVPWEEHPQSMAAKGKILIMSTEDHKRAVDEGLQIVNGINNDVKEDGGPFVAVGNPAANLLSSFYYKVRYKVCGDFFQLCPPKKNLESNLTNHYMGMRHAMKAQEAEKAKHSKGSAISTRQRGRPSVSRPSSGNQVDLHN